jgi:hypothetical protein
MCNEDKSSSSRTGTTLCIRVTIGGFRLGLLALRQGRAARRRRPARRVLILHFRRSTKLVQQVIRFCLVLDRSAGAPSANLTLPFDKDMDSDVSPLLSLPADLLRHFLLRMLDPAMLHVCRLVCKRLHKLCSGRGFPVVRAGRRNLGLVSFTLGLVEAAAVRGYAGLVRWARDLRTDVPLLRVSSTGPEPPVSATGTRSPYPYSPHAVVEWAACGGHRSLLEWAFADHAAQMEAYATLDADARPGSRNWSADQIEALLVRAADMAAYGDQLSLLEDLIDRFVDARDARARPAPPAERMLRRHVLPGRSNLLGYAASQGRVRVLRWLLGHQRVQVSAMEPNVAARYAAGHGHLAALQLILEGWNVNLSPNLQLGPAAGRCGHVAVLRWLAAQPMGEQLLRGSAGAAAGSGQVSVLELLIPAEEPLSQAVCLVYSDCDSYIDIVLRRYIDPGEGSRRGQPGRAAVVCLAALLLASLRSPHRRARRRPGPDSHALVAALGV